jgi:hypothetical protein
MVQHTSHLLNQPTAPWRGSARAKSCVQAALSALRRLARAADLVRLHGSSSPIAWRATHQIHSGLHQLGLSAHQLVNWTTVTESERS